MLIEEQIYQNALTHGHRTAIVAADAPISYLELWKAIVGAGDYLAARGLNPGDRLILSAEKSFGFVATYFGAHLRGIVCVPVDPLINESRLATIAGVTSAKASIGITCTDMHLPALSYGEISPADSIVSPCATDAAAAADIMFTTGTTGAPKGVLLSHANLAAAARNINTFIGNTADDIEVLALPVSHSFGLGRLRCVLSAGGEIVFVDSFASMKKLFAAIDRHNATGLAMVPSAWAYISKFSGDRIARFADALRYVEIGSARMPASEKRRLLSLLPHTRICMHYGLTEASRSAFVCFSDDPDSIESIGRESPNVSIAIFGSDGNPLPDGCEGEICVKGEHVCLTYLDIDGHEAAPDSYHGYMRTGDTGYRDAKGYLHICGRIKETINVGGKKVSPEEVEGVLNSYPGILESACVAKPDAMMGEVVKAFVVTSEGFDPDGLHAFMSARVENYKVPAETQVIEQIPKTSSGKIMRLALK